MLRICFATRGAGPLPNISAESNAHGVSTDPHGMSTTPTACQPTPTACQPTLTACQPTPTACQPTPTACQPTPTACQPTPTACQPTPTACQPTPHGMSADPHGVSADPHGVSTSHLGHAAVESECECSRPPPFPPPTHYPRHAGVERTFWPRLRKLCAASSSRLLSELWRHMLVAALKRTTTGEILL